MAEDPPLRCRQTLCSKLDDHAERLLEAEQRFLAAIAKRRSSVSPATIGLRVSRWKTICVSWTRCRCWIKENLHDFRKGAKKARYIAESDDKDAAAGAMAKAIKRVQDAIGEWHDWEVVAGEAREALGSDGDALRMDLEERAQRAYERALHTVATINRRLVGEWRAALPAKRARSRQPR